MPPGDERSKHRGRDDRAENPASFFGAPAFLAPYRSFNHDATRGRRDVAANLVAYGTRRGRRRNREQCFQRPPGEPGGLIDVERPAHRPADSCRAGAWTSSGEDEPIPLPADGLDSCRQVRVALDLRAELRDVNLAGPAAADMRAVPERLHDRGPADHATWLICEQNEEPELGGRQPHVLARDEDASAVEIDADVSEHAHVRTRADGGIDDLSRDPLDREQLAGLREYRRVALLDPDDRAVLPDPADDDGYAAGSTREQVVHDRAIIAVDELQRGRRVCVQLVRREPRHPHDRAADELVARGLQAVAKDDIRRSFDKAEQVVLSEALTGASAS